MRSTFWSLVVAVLLLGTGFVFWTVGAAEDRLAQIEALVAGMEYTPVADDGGDVDRSLAYARVVPGFGRELAVSAADRRATADYWLERYGALTLELERDAGGALVERDPRLLLLAANAAYRAGRIDTANRETALARLDAIIRNYADILRSGAVDGFDPALAEAAYNYEFAARLRGAIERTRAGSKPAPRPVAPAPALHGRRGGPPKDADPNDFRIVVPKRSDERDQNPEGGEGMNRIRKG